MKNIRACYRLLFFAFYTLFKSAQIVLANLALGTDVRRSIRIRQRWARTLLPNLGIKVRMTGAPPDFPCLLMANHRSYIDPALLARDVNGYGVAKAEVANWPVIGWGARVAGVLFLKRENLASRKVTLSGIAGKVKEGFPVIIFVEGTTHANPVTIDFKPGGFKLAAQNGIPIVPAAIEFRSPGDYWIGDDTFLPHLWRRLGEKEKITFVHYGPVIAGDDPQELMRQTKTWIDAELSRIRKGF